MHSDTLVKQNPVNSEKYAVMFSMLIKEFENRFQECWGKKKIVYLQLNIQLT